MARKPVPRMPEGDPPPYTCNECWFYETMELDHGACYGVPPTPVFNGEDLTYPRAIVLSDDRGCVHFKPRHSA